MAAILNAIQDYAIDVEVGSDFSAYRELRRPSLNSRPVYPMFDVRSSFVDESNALWIAGRDATGELVHTQAMRLFDMGTTTLGDHLRCHQQKYVTPGLVDNPCKTRYEAGGCLDRISGKVCYHGEFWIDSGPNGLRGSGAIALLSRLAFELAELTWGPDYVFGFVAARYALKGTPIRHGYYHAEPGRWIDADGHVFSDEWLVWMGAEDIAALNRTPFEASFRELEAAAERGRQGRALCHRNRPTHIESEAPIPVV
jgi:hypothetical protein